MRHQVEVLEAPGMAELAAKLASFKPTMLYIRGSPGAPPENVKGHLAPIYIANGPGECTQFAASYTAARLPGVTAMRQRLTSYLYPLIPLTCAQTSWLITPTSYLCWRMHRCHHSNCTPLLTTTDKLADHADFMAALEDVPLDTVYLDAAGQEKCEQGGGGLAAAAAATV